MVFGFQKTHTIHVWYVSCTGVFGAIGIILSLSDDSNMFVGQYVKGLVMTHRETSLGFSHAVMPSDRSPRSLGMEYCPLTQLALYHIHCFKLELSQIFNSRQLKRPSYQSKFGCAVINVFHQKI